MSQNADNTFTKDPDAVLDYVWDWTSWLESGDTISSYTVTVASGDVVLDSDSNTSSAVTAWFSGGTTFSSATCQIVTAEGRTDERTIYFDVEDR